MATFDQGDIVRVPFPYTDRNIRQFRPALVLSDGARGDGSLLWVAMITSSEHRTWPGDVIIGAPMTRTNLPAPSMVRTAKIATIEVRDATLLGRLDPAGVKLVREHLSSGLGLHSDGLQA